MSKVLVVDDDRDLRAVVKYVLVSAGYEVIESGDALAAIEQSHKDHPDLILLGLTISGSDATKALNELRQDPSTAEIPVVLLISEEQEATGALEDSSQYVLTNPFTSAQLQSKVHLAIAKSRNRTQIVPPVAMANLVDQPQPIVNPEQNAKQPRKDLTIHSSSLGGTKNVSANEATQTRVGNQSSIGRYLPSGTLVMIVMLITLGVVAALAPMAYPIRSGVLGTLDFSEIIAKLPLIDESEDDKPYHKWDPWLNCIAGSFDNFRQRAVNEASNQSSDQSGSVDRLGPQEDHNANVTGYVPEC